MVKSMSTVLITSIWFAGAMLAQSTPPAAAAAAFSTPMPLTEARLNAFFDAMDELRTSGAGAAAGAQNPTRPQAFAEALRVSGNAQEILTKNGFKDVPDFQRVAYNAAMAYAVLKEGGKEAVAKKFAKVKRDQAVAMDKLRQHLSADQIKTMTAQLDAAMAMAEAVQDVPPENLELMKTKKYQERMAQLSKP
jgi:hypothetical protein